MAVCHPLVMQGRTMNAEGFREMPGNCKCHAVHHAMQIMAPKGSRACPCSHAGSLNRRQSTSTLMLYRRSRDSSPAPQRGGLTHTRQLGASLSATAWRAWPQIDGTPVAIRATDNEMPCRRSATHNERGRGRGRGCRHGGRGRGSVLAGLRLRPRPSRKCCSQQQPGTTRV